MVMVLEGSVGDYLLLTIDRGEGAEEVGRGRLEDGGRSHIVGEGVRGRFGRGRRGLFVR